MRLAAVSTLQKIKQIHALQEHMKERDGSQMPVGVVDVLFEQPYCRIKDVVGRCSVTRQTATKYRGGLVLAGVLREEKFVREKLFLSEEIIDIFKQKEK